MEKVIAIDTAIIHAMIEARDAGLTLEQFVEMINAAHKRYVILPDDMIVEELEVEVIDPD